MQSDSPKIDFFSAPNLLTYTRIVAAFIFIYAIFFPTQQPLLVFVFLSVLVTDRLDGFLARKLRMTSVFGERLEMFADTFFTLSFMVYGLIRLGLPVFVPFLLGALFLLGLIAQTAVFFSIKKWFSKSLWPSKVSAFITYASGFFYLVDLPNKLAALAVAMVFAVLANIYHLFSLYTFSKK